MWTFRRRRRNTSRSPLTRQQQRTVARTTRRVHRRQVLVTLTPPEPGLPRVVLGGCAAIAAALVIVPWLIGVAYLLGR